MAIDRPVGVIREAFMGEKAVDNTEAGKMVTWARRVNAAIRPVDMVAKAWADVACGKVVGEITQSMGKKFASVAEIGAEQSKWAFGSLQNAALEQMKMAVGQVAYLAIVEGSGGMVGTPDFKAMLAPPANVANLDAALPTTVRGAGRDVVNCAFPNADVSQILTELNDAVGDGGYSLTDRSSLGLLQGYMDRIRQLGVATIKRNHPDRNQWLLVKNYVEALIKRLDQPPAPVQVLPPKQTPEEIELQKAQLKYYQEELEMKGNLAVVSEEEWLSGLMDKDYEKAQLPVAWMYKAPDWIPRNGKGEAAALSEWRVIYGMAEGLSYAVVQRRGDSEFGTKVEMVKAKIMNMKMVREKGLKKMYESNVYGFKGALELMVEELLVLGGDGTLIFKPETDQAVSDFFKDSGKYKEGLADRLWKIGVVKTKAQGQIMVAMASDFMEMGGVYELADEKRRLGYVSDALRTTMKPDNKFGPKISGGEIWGGPLGEAAMTIAGNNSVDAKSLLDRWGVVPGLLCGSAFSLKVKVVGGEEMPLGQALLNKKTIEFKDEEGDFYFKWKKDQVLPACDIFMYVTGKNKLEFRSLRETQAIITEWRQGLFNAIRGLRVEEKKLNLSFVPRETVAAAISGSTGIWPFEPMYLRINKSDESTNDSRFKDDYVDVGGAIVRGVAQDTIERDWLLEKFGISRRGVGDLFSKASDYDYVTNETVAKWLRLRVQKARGWKLITK